MTPRRDPEPDPRPLIPRQRPAEPAAPPPGPHPPATPTPIAIPRPAAPTAATPTAATPADERPASPAESAAPAAAPPGPPPDLVHVRVLDLVADAGPRLSTPDGTPADCPAGAVLALVRHAGTPVGLLDLELRAPGPEPLIACATARFGTPAAPDHAPGPPGPPAPRGTPRVSVIVATRERPELLAACLRTLLWQTYPDIELIVVDNAPTTNRTASVVRGGCAGLVRYVREPRPGLALAHNRGIAVATGELLAFTDDDVLADPGWVAALVAGFARAGWPACVTGLILPAELRTPAQLMLHHHAGLAKGFEPILYDPRTPPADPLFPFTAGRFGSGANMAFRADVLRAMGGFDPATGVGTPARGGDDLLAFFRTIVRGHRIGYEPGALIWHRHRADRAAVAAQVRGYGTGLGAYLTAAVLREPRTLGALARRAPDGIRYALARTRAPGRPDIPWPARLATPARRALAAGPLAYLRSRVRMHGVRAPWEQAESGR
ncbi:glycosyltransferase family 2 protein [Embleya hyalina]|uniref:Glycosyl transferase n=1 Tax=Embleya hyalina TaxID=516124 RepID=A0A401Z5I9_9ACTN|nr:glycosyltransferase [Embleya hyalina]GCE02107.1 glycosyl transferase [Embleya hyalina]GCE02158.1 glycosyl transferase [Embleya hyalina]